MFEAMQCDEGQVYKACGSACAATCEAMSNSATQSYMCESKCVEGCFCPDGMVLDEDNKCIAASDCKCFHEKRQYPVGSFLKKQCQDW
jgi:hypothetical protein